MKPTDEILVCAAADSALVVPGSNFTHTCSLCGASLMMAPSGQALLEEKPNLIVLCGACAFRAIQEAESVDIGLAGPIDRLVDEVRSSVPNLRRNRN